MRSALVVLFASDGCAKLRNKIKHLIPGKLVRKLDFFRVSVSERRFVRRRRSVRRAASGSLISASYLASKSVEEFLQSGVRPSAEAMSDIVAKSSGFEESLALYSLFFSQGLVRESTDLRVEARTQLLDIGRVSMGRTAPRLLTRLVGAAVEAGWTEETIEKVLGIKKIATRFRKPAATKHYAASNFSAGRGRAINATEFGKTLNSARVLVLGPKNTEGSLQRASLENFDVLVVLNFIAGTHPSEAAMTTARNSSMSTIVFYNEFVAKKMFYDRECRPSPEPDWSVYRSLSYAYQIRQCLAGTARTIRKNRDIVDGVWQGLPSVLFDLAQFGPSLIQVSGFDAYLSDRPYAPGYPAKDNALLYDLARHDPVGNFLFLQRLYDAGVFSADSALRNALNLNLFGYMSALDQSLGGSNRKAIGRQSEEAGGSPLGS